MIQKRGENRGDGAPQICAAVDAIFFLSIHDVSYSFSGPGCDVGEIKQKAQFCSVDFHSNTPQVQLKMQYLSAANRGLYNPAPRDFYLLYIQLLV